MTVIELRDRLNELMEKIPNTANDEIYYYDSCEGITDLHYFDSLDIEYDLNQIGRYICLK